MSSEALPVIVLTGFLGSGKTTLLNRLLRDWPRSAVLINEFGSTPVDQYSIEREGVPLMTLAGGCLGCQMREALAPVLKNLRMAWGRQGAPAFERLIIETSGVASPEPVLDSVLRDRWLARNYRLDAVIATVAVPSAGDELARFAEAVAQVAWADTLVLTQSDLADAATLACLEARLDELAPATPRIRAVQAKVDSAARLIPAEPVDRRIPDGSDSRDHGFRSVALEPARAIPWPHLRRILEDLLDRYPALVRVKGVVHLPDRFEPVAVHGAGGRLHAPVILPPRAAAETRGRLVLITAGSVGGLAEELMAAMGGTAESASVRWH